MARLAPDTFLILTGTAQATRDAHWIRRHIPTSARAVLTDVTSGYAVIGVAGPRSRELLGRVTDAALGHASVPPEELAIRSTNHPPTMERTALQSDLGRPIHR